MSFSYYIKKHSKPYDHVYNFDEDKKKFIEKLLDNIYKCCKNGNIGKDNHHYNKIHRTDENNLIITDITFKDIIEKYPDNEIEKKN